jgi:hypothetical protein
MTRAADPTYLGGIGLMLEVAHVCPRCGKRLSDSPTAANRHLAGSGCRPPVFAALPEPEPTAQEEDVPLTPAARRIRDFETPVAPQPRRAAPSRELLPTTTIEPTGRAFTAPWLRPPDLGEVL